MSRSAEVDLAALAADPRVAWSEDVLRFGDTDANGHINNAAFAIFCESGRVAFLEGVIRSTLRPDVFFVVARLTIEFRAELHYPGHVRCGTWLGALGRTSVTFRQVLLDERGGLAATSEAVTVTMDGTTRRPAVIGPETRAALEPRMIASPLPARRGEVESHVDATG